MDQVDCIVIGAGVVGLAIARALAVAGREVIVVDAAHAIGTGVSSRNSEVIHAGIYYPAGSLKAQLCVRGKQLLYDYCAQRQVAHQRCGKLLVATALEDVPKLQSVMARANANGVNDLRLLSAAQAQALEPALQCHAAVLSPSTGIVDSHGLMLSLLGEAQAAGAFLALNSPVLGARAQAEGWVIQIGGTDAYELQCRWLINCAGLSAQLLAARMQGFAPTAIAPLWLAKGNYFSLNGKAPFSHLIYPLPSDGGLGVHLTLDLAGQAKFGPDVQWLPHNDPATVDYAVQPNRADSFYSEIRRYWPQLADGQLTADYSGVRPKLSGPGQDAADFVIAGPLTHGHAGLVQLFGIESPGLTSSLAIAQYVARHCLGLK
jgi:L-2-hydroxyglutarate oxidase LhgO